MDRNKVFISSTMGGDVDAERQALIEVVDANPYLRAWDFGREPAAPGALKKAYLRHVDDCALFIAIVGAEITDPVEEEFDRAEETGREILVFRKRVANPSGRVRSFLQRVDVKYASFEAVADFRKVAKAAIDDYLASLVAQRSRPSDVSRSMLHQLRQFGRDGARVFVRPAVPREFDMDQLTVKRANADAVELQKESSETIWITTPQIASVFPSTPADPGKILLRGRLQWVSVPGHWAIFDEAPATEYGVPKSSGRADARILEIQRHCQSRRHSIRWVLANQVWTFSLLNGTCSTILMADTFEHWANPDGGRTTPVTRGGRINDFTGVRQ